MSLLLFVVAAILFVLAGLGVNIESIEAMELAFFGLASLALAHVVPLAGSLR